MNRTNEKGWMAAAAVALFVILLWSYPLATMRLAAQWDVGVHLRWAAQFHTALQEGWLLPRWAWASLGGLGDPTFFYYQPLFYYITSAFSLVGIGPEYSLLLSGIVIYGLLAACVYRFLLRHCPPYKAALGAGFVLASPPMFFLATQMSAFPWVLSFPFSIWFILESLRQRPRPARLAMLIALVSFSHLLSAMMTLLCTGFALLFLVPWNRDAIRRHLAWGGGVALGLCLTAFFFYPAITQLGLITPEGWTNGASYDWRRAFAFPVVTYFQYGLKWFGPQLPFPMLVLLMAGLALLPLKAAAPTPSHSTARKLAVVALIALALGTELAYPLYVVLTPLHKLQFPYRFLFLAALLAAMALALRVHEGAWARWSKPVRALALLLVLAYFGQLAVLQLKLIKDGRDIPDRASVMAGRFGQPEYVPAVRGPAWTRYLDDGKLEGECRRLGLACSALRQRSHDLSVVIETPRAASVRLPLFAFPAWEASVDGQAQPRAFDPASGLLQVNLAPGRHVVTVRWARLPAEVAGLWVSAAALLVWLGLLAVGRRRAALPAPEAALAPGMKVRVPG